MRNFNLGKYSSTRFSFLNFKISKCVNKTNETCASQEKIDNFSNKKEKENRRLCLSEKGKRYKKMIQTYVFII